MNRINKSHKEIAYTEIKKIIIIKEVSGIYGDNKNPAGYNDTEKLSQTMEKEITPKAGKIETPKGRNNDKDSKIVLFPHSWWHPQKYIRGVRRLAETPCFFI